MNLSMQMHGSRPVLSANAGSAFASFATDISISHKRNKEQVKIFHAQAEFSVLHTVNGYRHPVSNCPQIPLWSITGDPDS